MSILSLTTGELRHLPGLLHHGDAVFGVATGEPIIPTWLDDDLAVHRAVAAKRAHGAMPHVWPGLAVLAQICAALVRGCRPDEALTRTGIELANLLAAHLPAPPPALYDRGFDVRPSWREIKSTGPRLDHLSHCACHLAAALEPGWTDPDEIAGTVEDALVALRTYRLVRRLAARRSRP